MRKFFALASFAAAGLFASPLVITTPIPISGSATVDSGDGVTEISRFQFSNVPGSADTITASGFQFGGDTDTTCFFPALAGADGCPVLGNFTVDGTSFGAGDLLLPTMDGPGHLVLRDMATWAVLGSVALAGDETNFVVTMPVPPGCSIFECGETTTFDIVPPTPEPATAIPLLLAGVVGLFRRWKTAPHID